jgi:tripartite-type tricarboxylate transporter receptor subunit TctC
MRMDRRAFVLGAAALGLMSSQQVLAQSAYPNRPVRLIVPYPPGGGTDFFARLVGTSMAQTIGQPIVIENRPGAGSIIGAEAAARATPDGYTFLLGDVATYAANPSLYKKLPYDPQKDFSPITLTGRFAMVLLVNTNKLKVGSVAELVEAAKKAPGAIDYASGGIGNPFHLASELFADAAQIQLHHIPYRGAAPAIQDLVAGQIGMMFVDFATARAQLKTPGIRPLAVASLTELPGLPGVPPLAASGYPGFEVWAWQGLVAPAGTPADIVEKLRKSYLVAIEDAENRKKLEEAGIDVRQSTPEEFAAYMRSETARWDALIKKANIHAD